MLEKELKGVSVNNAPDKRIAEKVEFEKIRTTDIEGFISFLRDARPDYPYRWFFDRNWIGQRISDPFYIWGVLKVNKNIIGTIICYYEPEKKINTLKLLLVHPQYRKQGILNTIFFDRLQERRVIDQIQSSSPNLLYAEVLMNHSTSQNMIQRMGMIFCGFFPNKTRIEGIPASLTPCALLFKRNSKILNVDKRISNKLEKILKYNRIQKIRPLSIGRDEQEIRKGTQYDYKEEINCELTENKKYLVKIDANNYLKFQFNTYLNCITDTRLYTKNPEIAQFFIEYLLSYNANYLEALIPPELWLQDILICNHFKFTAFIPSFWDGEDVLFFSTWKNRPVLTPMMKPIYNIIMEADAFE